MLDADTGDPTPITQGISKSEEPQVYSAPRRPLALTVLILLNFASASLYLLLFMLNTFSHLYRGRVGGIDPWLWLADAAVNLVIGSGLWLLKSWARIGAIVLYSVGIALDVCSLLAAPAFSGVFQLVMTLLFLGIVTRRDVEAACT